MFLRVNKDRANISGVVMNNSAVCINRDFVLMFLIISTQQGKPINPFVQELIILWIFCVFFRLFCWYILLDIRVEKSKSNICVFVLLFEPSF